MLAAAILRDQPKLKEKQQGIYGLKPKVFLCFHQEPIGLYADVKIRPLAFSLSNTTTSEGLSKWVNSIKGFFEKKPGMSRKSLWVIIKRVSKRIVSLR